MRARHRHVTLNRNAAAACFDARGIQQSDNSAVSTWSDRSGNGKDASQATAANQPTLRTAAMGGQAVVRFDGATANNQDWLGVSSLSVSQPLFFVSACVCSNGADYLFDATSNSSRVAAGMALSSGTAVDYGKIGLFAGSVVQGTADLRGITIIWSGVFDGSSSSVRRDGASVASGAGGAANMATLKIGERFANINNVTQLKGDVGLLAIVSGSSASLRRRFEHAAAYSFKIACN